MSEVQSNIYDEANTTSIDAIKVQIAAINSKPLSEHSEEFEAVHVSLQRALSEIDGL
jgi:hypothetical protein